MVQLREVGLQSVADRVTKHRSGVAQRLILAKLQAAGGTEAVTIAQVPRHAIPAG
jgi:hypothetical protein